jgi:hypothetical protein
MLGRWWRTGLAAALGGALLVGCDRNAVRQDYPPDPLFLSKKPVEASPEGSRPLLAHNEPAAPRLPTTAVVSAPREHVVLKPHAGEPAPPPPDKPGAPAAGQKSIAAPPAEKALLPSSPP